MLANYHDILRRIPEPPRWFDEHGVPRWCDFHPKECANIYADEVALIEIQCQNCSQPFNVCMSSSSLVSHGAERLTYLLKIGESTTATRPTSNAAPLDPP